MKSLLWWPEKNNKAYFLLLSLLSALLLSAGWLWHILVILIFVAWLPLIELDFQLEKEPGKRKGWVFFGYVYLTMLSWNLITTWWIINSTVVGALMAFGANSLLMTIPIALYRKTRIRLGNRMGFLSLVAYWLCLEYLHLNWDLSWSWLNLGNVFAFRHHWVQWYDYTGALGGTLWVLLVNILVYRAFFMQNRTRMRILSVVLALSIPFSIGYYRFFTYHDEGQKIEVVAVQPNIDPYTEKFADSPNFVPLTEQVNRFITLSEKAITPKTKFVLWPETAISTNIDEASFGTDPVIARLQQFVDSHPGLSLVTGITTYKIYPSKQEATATSRMQAGVGYYDVFNSALFISQGNPPGIYHKSKLVPGVEQMPYPEVFGLLSALVIDMGGASGGLGKQEDRTVFQNADGIVGPVICYESVYGDFVTGYVSEGANFIGIITNDGWWGDTPGHKQHLAYASLRAIENRRPIARSANTGISAFLDSRGNVEQVLPYLTMGTLQQEVVLNNELTFYTRFGDILGKMAEILAPSIFVWSFLVRYFTKRVKPV